MTRTVSLGVLALLVSLLVPMSVAADRVPPGTDDEIAERLRPFGELCRSGDDCAGAGGAVAAAAGGEDSGAAAGMSGEQVYNQFCFVCHAAGVGGAPILGDAAAWEPRLAKGEDALWQTTVNGLGAMPPKGTCMACSDDELRAAMTYMLEQVP